MADFLDSFLGLKGEPLNRAHSPGHLADQLAVQVVTGQATAFVGVLFSGQEPPIGDLLDGGTARPIGDDSSDDAGVERSSVAMSQFRFRDSPDHSDQVGQPFKIWSEQGIGLPEAGIFELAVIRFLLGVQPVD